ncbi:hypothetical protein F5Y04DRAFT_276773 [Hypomontagnella monticulosa]|nr:hypothetical protein F5Y04DRAFT_276773 [Hypomontagnella monticulosa]
MHFITTTIIVYLASSAEAVAVPNPGATKLLSSGQGSTYEKRNVEDPDLYFDYDSYKKRDVENPDVYFNYDAYKKRDPENFARQENRVSISIPTDETGSIEISIPPTQNGSTGASIPPIETGAVEA